MKFFLLIVAALIPFQLVFASSKTEVLSPLATAIQEATKKGGISQAQIERLVEAGVRHFDMNSFDVLLPDQKIEVKPVLQTDQAGKKHILIQFKDSKSGLYQTLQTSFDYEKAKQASPTEIYKLYKEQVTRKPSLKEMLIRLPMESLVFYYGLGLNSMLNLVATAEQDPKAFERYIESLADPVAQLSFMAFVLANHASAGMMNRSIFGSMFSKNMSDMAKIRISKFIIPHLGMAFGGLASNAVHDLVNITRSCSRLVFQMTTTLESKDTKEICDLALQQTFSSQNAGTYATATLSLVTTAFAMSGIQGLSKFVGTKVGGAIGAKAIINNVAIRLASFATFVPTPMARMSLALKNGTKSAIHLMGFLQLDQRVFHPFYHHIIEQRITNGPTYQIYQKEILRRLSQTEVVQKVHRGQRLTSKGLSDSIEYLKQGVIGLFSSEKKDFETEAYVEDEAIIKMGEQESYQPLHWTMKAYNWTPLSLVSGRYEDNWIESMDFNELLAKHFEVSDAWRQSLMGKMNMEYQSWLDMIAPFNAATQMTYDFYYNFYDLLNTPNLSDGSVNNLYEANILHAINLRDLNGNLIEESAPLNDKQIAQYKMNTIQLSKCWIDTLERYSRQKKVKNHSIHYGHLIEGLKEVKKDLFQDVASNIICNGDKFTLKANKSIPSEKLNKGLSRLRFLISRYAKEENLFTDAFVVSTDSQTYAPLRYTSKPNAVEEAHTSVGVMNLLTNLTAYLNGRFSPYERGEQFLEEWNYTFKEGQPDHYKYFGLNPAAGLLRAMTCPSSKQQPLIVHNKLFGKLSFTPPQTTTKANHSLCNAALTSYSQAEFDIYNVRSNPSIGELIDAIAKNTKPEIKHSFVSWWDDNIESKISDQFSVLNEKYTEALKNSYNPLVKENEHVPLQEVPRTITASFINQQQVYLELILALYSSMQNDDRQVHLAHQLKREILASLRTQLVEFTRPETDKDELSRSYGRTLALIKKFKTLIIAPNMNDQLSTQVSDSVEQVREALSYYREKLAPSRPELLRGEYINALENRVMNDPYTNQAFREHIEDVGKRYESLHPVFFTKAIPGNGILPVKVLYNYIVEVSESVFRIAKIARLTTASNYMEKDDEDVERRGKGSRKSF